MHRPSCHQSQDKNTPALPFFNWPPAPDPFDLSSCTACKCEGTERGPAYLIQEHVQRVLPVAIKIEKKSRLCLRLFLFFCKAFQQLAFGTPDPRTK